MILTVRIGRRSAAVRLPVVIALPVAGGEVILATRETWPVERDLYCAELASWPDDALEVERWPVITCERRGAAITLTLDRSTRRRSLFVWTTKQGRPLVFWRSERSMRAIRPGIRSPTARALDGPLHVIIDDRERHPWRFATLPVTTERRRLPAGDYGVASSGRIVAVAERKKLPEFARDAVSGHLQLLLAELSAQPRALLLVEGRLSQLLSADAPVQPGWLLNLFASLQAAHPNVPIHFAETSALAANIAYRWLAASLLLARSAEAGVGLFAPAAQGVAVTRLDAATVNRHAREGDARSRAAAGEVLTVRGHAERFAITAATASSDLHALVGSGALRVEGAGRARRFVSAIERAATETGLDGDADFGQSVDE